MNGRQRRKLFAGIGVISMLLGVLMVVAPTLVGAAPTPEFVADNPGCDDITGEYEVEAKDDSGADSGAVTASDGLGNELSVSYQIDQDGTVSFEVSGTSDYLVSAVLIKQGNYLGNNSAAVYYYDPPVASDSGLEIFADQASEDDLSHITFCGATGGLSVEKDATGDGQPTDDPDYSFTLACTNNGNDITLQGDDSSFDLKDGETKNVPDPSTDVGIPLTSTCTLTETEANGAVTTISVDGDPPTEGTSRSGIVITSTTTGLLHGVCNRGGRAQWVTAVMRSL